MEEEDKNKQNSEVEDTEVKADSAVQEKERRPFGDLLKEYRLKRKVSIAEISNSVKIKPKTIGYLEDSRLDELPKKVFIEGLVRSYCQFLGEDPKPVFELLNASFFKPDEFAQPKGILQGENQSRPFFLLETFQKTILPIITFVVVLGGVFLVYQFSKNGVSSNTSKLNSSTEKIGGRDNAKLVAPDLTDSASSAMTNDLNAQTLTGISADENNPTNNLAGADTARLELTGTENSLQENVVEKKINTLSLEPLATAVIYVKTENDEEPVKAILRPNRLKRYKFKSAEVRFLDAGAVNVLFNGRDLGVLGGFGEDKTIVFPQDSSQN